jgi:hypothetical protein
MSEEPNCWSLLDLRYRLAMSWSITLCGNAGGKIGKRMAVGSPGRRHRAASAHAVAGGWAFRNRASSAVNTSKRFSNS